MKRMTYKRLSWADKKLFVHPARHLFRCTHCGAQLMPQDCQGHPARCPKRPK